MNKLFQKHRILESLDDLDHAQTEQVLDYIHRLVNGKKEQSTYQHNSKREAMVQIRQALNKGRSVQTGF
jgi:hypothetical protein